jgi:hypothetical protein
MGRFDPSIHFALSRAWGLVMGDFDRSIHLGDFDRLVHFVLSLAWGLYKGPF